MIINYINVDGNWAETEDTVVIPENLEKIDNIYFEKRVVIKETKTAKKEEAKEEIKEEVKVDDTEERALTYLKEQKVRGAHMFKGQKLIDKAVENGFII